MKRFFSIYLVCIKTAIIQVMAYRVNSLLTAAINLVSNLLFPLVTILIYQSGAAFPGWSLWEVLLMQSIFTVAVGLSNMMLVDVFWGTSTSVQEGTFEVVLLKPMNPLFFFIATHFAPESLGLLVGGGVMFAVAVAHTGIASLLAVLQFTLLFFAGFAVMAGLHIMMAATSFQWVGNSRIPEIFDSITTFGKYPATIFPSVIQAAVTFVIPVSLVGFFPAQAILGKAEAKTLVAVVPCGLFLWFAVWLYGRMIKQYKGAGG